MKNTHREVITDVHDDLSLTADSLMVLKAAAHGIPDYNKNIQENLLHSIESMSTVIYDRLMESITKLEHLRDER